MAESFASSAYFTRSSAVPGTTFTFSMWVLTAGISNNQCCLSLYGGGNYAYCQVYTAGTTSLLFGIYDGADRNTGAVALQTNTWYFIAGTRAVSTMRFYYARLGQSVVTPVTAQTGITGTATPTNIILGNDNNLTSNNWNGSIDAINIWDGLVLTEQELNLQLQQKAPIQRRNLYGTYLMPPGVNARELDYSGIGHPMTTGGTITDVIGVNIPYRVPAKPYVMMPSATEGELLYPNPLDGLGYQFRGLQ